MPEDNKTTEMRLGKRHRVLTIGFSILIFIASAWYIVQTFQWHELGQTLKNVNLPLLLLGGSATIIIFWILRTLRWRILLRRTDTHVPIIDLYMCTAVALSFSLITPFQSGEMLKIELLKKYGMLQRAPGYGSFLVERVLDTATLLAIAGISLLTSIDILPNRTYAYWLLGGLALACITGLIVLAKLRLKGRLQQLMGHMRQCVGDILTLLIVIVITCLSWAAVAFIWQVFLYSAGIQIHFAQSMAIMSIIGLVGILSLIPGGLGISEAGITQLLVHFAFATAIAQAGSLIIRSVSLVAIVLGGGHLGLWKLIRIHRNNCDAQKVGKEQ